MSKTDWNLMHLVDKELLEAIGIESGDWKFNNSPAGMINVARREKKVDSFHYLREAVSYILLQKTSTIEDGKEAAKFMNNGIHGFAVFIEENENLKKFLDS